MKARITILSVIVALFTLSFTFVNVHAPKAQPIKDLKSTASEVDADSPVGGIIADAVVR